MRRLALLSVLFTALDLLWVWVLRFFPPLDSGAIRFAGAGAPLDSMPAATPVERSLMHRQRHEAGLARLGAVRHI